MLALGVHLCRSFSSLERCCWRARWRKQAPIYTKEIKRGMGTLDNAVQSQNPGNSKLDFVLTLCFLAFLSFMMPKVKFQINRFFWFIYFAENQIFVCVCVHVPVSTNLKIA